MLQGFNETKTKTLDLEIYRKETPVQVSSYEFYETFKNTYFVEHRRTTSPAG